MFPLALLPIVLESAHLGAFIGPLGILECVFKTALLALRDEEEDEPAEHGGPNASSSDVYTGLGPRREFGPLLGQGFWWVLDGIGDGGVAPGYPLVRICQEQRQNLRDDIDALPGARVIGVAVLLAGVEIMHPDALEDHGKRGFRVVHQTTGPFDRALRIPLNTGRPDAIAKVARSLRVILAGPLGVFVRQGPDEIAVNPPLQLLFGPVSGVVVEFGVGIGDIVVTATIEGLIVTLAEIVRLDLAGVVTHPFPVNLIQVVRLQHDTADNTGALGHLDVGLDNTEEDVKV